MLIDLIAGARPNFVKIAALIHAIKDSETEIDFRLIHTGQHYNKNLSGSFFEQLEIPSPDINLQIGSGSQSEQTAAIMLGYEKVLLAHKPDLCVVVGDVTSSMACAITAKKLGVPVAHVEAGIRSGDMQMPEEINRILIDSISDLFFTTTWNASENLLHSGKKKEQVFFVGNTMIDTLLKFRPKFQMPSFFKEWELETKEYLVLTLHRPSNVDDPKKLKKLLDQIISHSRKLPIVFPVHPRTEKILQNLNLEIENLHLIEPLTYLEFNYLVERAKVVITDSGGITEETTVFGIPCMTLRNSTERPETIEVGTNVLIGMDPGNIGPAMKLLFSNKWKKGRIPELWDGNSAKRIVSIMAQLSF